MCFEATGICKLKGYHAKRGAWTIITARPRLDSSRSLLRSLLAPASVFASVSNQYGNESRRTLGRVLRWVYLYRVSTLSLSSRIGLSMPPEVAPLLALGAQRGLLLPPLPPLPLLLRLR